MKTIKRLTKKELLKQIRVHKKRAKEYHKMYVEKVLLLEEKKYGFDKLMRINERLLESLDRSQEDLKNLLELKRLEFEEDKTKIIDEYTK